MDDFFHLKIAWMGLVLGALSGAALGLFFHRDQWLGGYGSWARRMLRLGHISFFGLAGLNLALALTLGLRPALGLPWISAALLVGTVGMPAVCFLSAWRKPLRHLFFIPVVGISGSLLGMTWLLWTEVPS